MDNCLKTRRLILRTWREEDAESLYRYASDPRVGVPAGWPPHESVEMSREVILTVFSVPETYAVVPEGGDGPVGCVGLVPRESRHVEGLKENDAEIGYWIGTPWWGRGLIPEAVAELMRHCREDLGCDDLWIGFFDGNDKSRRVAEKCGFSYHHTQTSDGTVEHFYINRK